MSELPRIPFNMPDTWMVKESCPTKSELAVYENPGPSNFTWPDCGGENELRGLNGYTSMAKTTGATLPATGLHGPINGIRFQLILRTHRQDAWVSKCWSNKYQQECKQGCA